MPLFWCDANYLLVMTIVGAGLFVSLRWLLKRLQRHRLQKTSGTKRIKAPALLRIAMAAWLFAAALYSLELTFGAFVEFTDAFSATNISDRWFARYVEPYRNSQGFRDSREFATGVKDDVTQVYFVGDSFTIGQGIERLEDRFTEITEEIIKARTTPRDEPTIVYNAAEFGWEVSVIEGMVTAFKKNRVHPNILVYVYMLNDIEGYDPRTTAAIQKIQESEPRSWLLARTYFFNWLYFRWQQSRASRTVDYFPHLADSYRGTPWEGTRQSMLAIKATCDRDNMDFRMVFFPFLHNLGPDYEFKHAHKQLANFCSENSIPYLDLEPVLTPRSSEGLVVSQFDNHPNELCHAIAAEAIASQLLKDLPLPKDVVVPD